MKTVLITGTSKGIELETVLAFGRAGYKVFATMRNPENAATFKQQIKAESLPISIHKMDVDSDESVKQSMETIIQENGIIDVLVNNAGIEHNSSIEEMEMTDFKAVMETNYFGVLPCIKSVLPIMRKNRKGCIINISSVFGHIASTALDTYSASKQVLEAIFEALAQEVKPFNIRVAILEPGIINTDMARDINVVNSSIYPQSKRFGELFAAYLKTPTPPSLVADTILGIAESGT